MRSLVTPRRALEEIAPYPDGMFRGRLAEDYDGIGQFVMVVLSHGSVGSGFKARVASGDFGGGRTFPAGIPVHIHSYRGLLEVFLGNLPHVCDLFNRETLAPDGGWGTGIYGDWLTIQQMMTVPDPQAVSYAWVENGSGILQYVTPDPFNDPSMGIAVPEDLAYPFEVKIVYTIEEPDPDDANATIYFGPIHYLTTDTWTSWQIIRLDSSTSALDVSFRDAGPYNWPDVTEDPASAFMTETHEEATLVPHIMHVRFDAQGTFGKFWRVDQSEPLDWQVRDFWVGSPPPIDYIRYIYVESQNLPFPEETPVPKFRLDMFCLFRNVPETIETTSPEQ